MLFWHTKYIVLEYPQFKYNYRSIKYVRKKIDYLLTIKFIYAILCIAYIYNFNRGVLWT